MYAPIFFPPAPKPSPDVLAAERAILDAEGPCHVEGRYFARTGDADQMRRLVAERRVRDAEREAAAGAALDRITRDAADVMAQTVERDGEPPRPAALPTGAMRAARATCATWLTPRERVRVDAATSDDLAVRHHETLRALRDDLARGAADGALVSAARVQPVAVASLAALVRDFPGAPVVGLVDEGERPDAHLLASVLLLGRAGVRVLVDVRTPRGWSALRATLDADALPDAFRRRAVASMLAEIAGSERAVAALRPGCVRFFALVFAPGAGSAKAIAADLGAHPTTLCSRFIRAGLPSPKRYATTARLVLAAHFAERSGVRVGDLARRLGVSSAQSLGRTVRAVTGLRASEFRVTFDGDTMLRHFNATLVMPYRDRLRTFDPTGFTESAGGDASGARVRGRVPSFGRAA